MAADLAAGGDQVEMNVGTIVETDTIKVRLKGGPVLGEIEDYFVQGLSAGDTFIFAGRVLEFAGMKANQALARPGRTGEPKIPAYAGAACLCLLGWLNGSGNY